jgi:aminopeptidase N
MIAIQKNSVHLDQYKPPQFLITDVELTFDLDVEATIVTSKLKVERNRFFKHPETALELNGKKLKLLSISLNDKQLVSDDYTLSDELLTLPTTLDSFVLTIECQICPRENTELYGLYLSNGFLCSHNEPEGFRHITYFTDRPDVMAKFKTKLIGDRSLFPVLLSNGNCIEKGLLPDGKHFAVWEDPFKKPCYLFALVAGNLSSIHDTFRTKSGKTVELSFYTELGKQERAKFAMQALKNSMHFDEVVFGREYDLNCYMIVAVDSFNMGAMENKGLNIFNTAAAFADQDTATDENFLRVETVIAHEYFHNWSGNRIGVRDWFQLTLKEGLTVFRDQEFTAYMHNRSLKRIEDVIKLRTRQFPEDQGPTSHPIQPKSYVEINNFYTPTVYDKGAEVVRMLKTLLGEAVFLQGVSLFFDRYDGLAVTVEEWIQAMEAASTRDLGQFRRWYHQSGTLVLKVDYQYEESLKQLTLNVQQSIKCLKNTGHVEPLHFPLKVGLIDLDGKPVSFTTSHAGHEDHAAILEVNAKNQTFVLRGVEKACIPSINQNYSAPMILEVGYSMQELMHLARHDKDPFNRYEAMFQLSLLLLQEQVAAFECQQPVQVDEQFLITFGKILSDPTLDLGLKAKLLKLSNENDLALVQAVTCIDANHAVWKFFVKTIAQTFEREFLELYHDLNTSKVYTFDVQSASKRRMKNLALFYLCQLESDSNIELAVSQYHESNNMNDRFAALDILVCLDRPEKHAILKAFYERYESDTLVMMKWIGVQATAPLPSTLGHVREIVESSVFQLHLPNHVKALFITLVDNLTVFHRMDGKAYAFYFENLKKVDGFNPQMAAMMAQALKKLHKLDLNRKERFKEILQETLSTYQFSSNVFEILDKLKGSL